MAASLAWGGHRNGYIPATAMVSIGRGFLLERTAALQFLAARAFILAAIGVDLLDYISETYRDYAGQVYQRQRWTALGKPNNAAVPGSSIHGWAKAIDFNADALVRDGIYDYVMGVLEQFGFIRDVSGESWHTSFREASVTTWADNSTTPIEEEDMTPEQHQTLNEIRWLAGEIKGQTDKLGRIAVATDLVLWATTDPAQGLRRMVANLSTLAVQLDANDLTKEQVEQALRDALAPFTATTIAVQTDEATARVLTAAAEVARASAEDAPAAH